MGKVALGPSVLNIRTHSLTTSVWPFDGKQSRSTPEANEQTQHQFPLQLSLPHKTEDADIWFKLNSLKIKEVLRQIWIELIRESSTQQ